MVVALGFLPEDTFLNGAPMGVEQWMLLAMNATVAAILLNAGIGKVVAPQYVQLALAEILPTLRDVFTAGWVRAIAVVEIAVAGTLLTTATRVVGALATTGLGLCFALLGMLGLLRSSSTPCGCLGGQSRRPLGWTNIGFGFALTAAGSVNLFANAVVPAEQYATGAVVLTAIGSIALCLWTRRRTWLQLRPPRRTTTAGSEVQ